MFESGHNEHCLKSLIAAFIVRILLAMSSYITSNVINISHKYIAIRLRAVYSLFLFSCLATPHRKPTRHIDCHAIACLLVYFSTCILTFHVESNFSACREFSLYTYIQNDVYFESEPTNVSIPTS